MFSTKSSFNKRHIFFAGVSNAGPSKFEIAQVPLCWRYGELLCIGCRLLCCMQLGSGRVIHHSLWKVRKLVSFIGVDERQAWYKGGLGYTGFCIFCHVVFYIVRASTKKAWMLFPQDAQTSVKNDTCDNWGRRNRVRVIVKVQTHWANGGQKAERFTHSMAADIQRSAFCSPFSLIGSPVGMATYTASSAGWFVVPSYALRNNIWDSCADHRTHTMRTYSTLYEFFCFSAWSGKKGNRDNLNNLQAVTQT